MTSCSASASSIPATPRCRSSACGSSTTSMSPRTRGANWLPTACCKPPRKWPGKPTPCACASPLVGITRWRRRSTNRLASSKTSSSRTTYCPSTATDPVQRQPSRQVGSWAALLAPSACMRLPLQAQPQAEPQLNHQGAEQCQPPGLCAQVDPNRGRRMRQRLLQRLTELRQGLETRGGLGRQSPCQHPVPTSRQVRGEGGQWHITAQYPAFRAGDFRPLTTDQPIGQRRQGELIGTPIQPLRDAQFWRQRDSLAGQRLTRRARQ